MEKPDVDAIEGLSPAISIEQKTTGQNPRSTVGTVTEIYDYLRLLWARVGVPHCPNDGTPVTRQSAAQITETVLGWPEETRIEVLAPMVRGPQGRIPGPVRRRAQARLRPGAGGRRDLRPGRGADAQPAAESRHRGRGGPAGGPRGGPHPAQRLDRDRAQDGGRRGRGGAARRDAAVASCSRERFACPVCGLSLPELEPRQFSFNSPFGACPDCHGVGTRREVNADLVLGDPSISILEGVILPWGEPTGYLRKVVLPTLAKAFKFDLNAPWGEHSEAAKQALLHGAPGRFKFQTEGARGTGEYESEWEGVLRNVERRYRESSSDAVRVTLEEFMIEQPCQTCGGKRLKPESLSVLVHGAKHRRRGGPAGRARARVLREHPAPLATARPRARSRDRGPHPQGGQRPAALPPRCRARVPDARPRRDVALRRRDPADPARHPDRLPAGRRALHPGRAQHRAAPAGQRAAARHPARAARPGQHGDRGRARRGHDPGGRPRHRPGSAGGPLRRRGGGRGDAWRTSGSHPDVAHRPLSARRAAGPGAARPARGAAQAPAPGRRRAGQQPAEPHGGHSARPVRGGHRRVRLGEVHPRHRHPLPGAGAALLSRQGRARARTPGSRGSTRSTRSSTSTRARSAGRPRSNPATYTGLFTPIRELFTQLPDAKLRGYGPGPLLLQREGRTLRGVPGRRAGEDRDALPARRLRALRGVQGPALQPGDAGGPLQGPEHRRRARPHRGRRPRLLRQPAADRGEAGAA